MWNRKKRRIAALEAEVDELKTRVLQEKGNHNQTRTLAEKWRRELAVIEAKLEGVERERTLWESRALRAEKAAEKNNGPIVSPLSRLRAQLRAPSSDQAKALTKRLNEIWGDGLSYEEAIERGAWTARKAVREAAEKQGVIDDE